MIAWALAAAVIATPPACSVSPDRRDDVAWLEAKCKRLTEAEAPRLERAQTVFDRMRKLVPLGRRSWLKLLVLRSYPGVHAWTTSDGTVVLSAKALSLCYEDARARPLPLLDGDARIAFVLAHELAHQVHGDLPAGFLDGDPGYRKARAAASENNELSADMVAIVDVARAGYRPAAVLAGAGRASLLHHWLTGGAASVPVSQAVKDEEDRLRRTLTLVSDHLDLDDAGVLLLEVGYAEDAAALIDAFKGKTRFLGAAEFNNAAQARHQLALRALSLCSPRQALRFRLPTIIDPDTAARNTRGGDEPREDCRRSSLVSEPLARATEELHELVRTYPDYAPGHVNLVATLITADNPAAAFAAAGQALSTASPLPLAERILLAHLSALAQYLQADKQKFDEPRRAALSQLAELAGHAGDDAALAYNLARMTSELLGAEAASDLWKRALRLEPRGPYADEARRSSGDEKRDDPWPEDADDGAPNARTPEPPVPLGLVARDTRERLNKLGGTRAFVVPGYESLRVHHGADWTAYEIDNVIKVVVDESAAHECVDDIAVRQGPAKAQLSLPGGRRVLRYDGLAFEALDGAVVRRIHFIPPS